MTERVRLRVQASEMKFLRKIEKVALFNKVHSFEIRKSFIVELLFIRAEKSQL